VITIKSDDLDSKRLDSLSDSESDSLSDIDSLSDLESEIDAESDNESETEIDSKLKTTKKPTKKPTKKSTKNPIKKTNSICENYTQEKIINNNIKKLKKIKKQSDKILDYNDIVFYNLQTIDTIVKNIIENKDINIESNSKIIYPVIFTSEFSRIYFNKYLKYKKKYLSK
jgi:hypothetical protein